MAEVQHFTVDNFDEKTSSGVVLIDFWATWCGPCRMLNPILDQVAQEVEGKAIVGKVNIEESQDLAVKFNVRSIPAIFVLKDGEVVKNFTGLQDKTTLLDAIKNA